MQNFLGIFKIISQLIKYKTILRRKSALSFLSKTTNYYWWSLKQWSQDVKWQNQRTLIYSIINLRYRQREGIRRYKHLFYRKGYKRDPNNPITAWQSWKIKNKNPSHYKKTSRYKKKWISKKKKKRGVSTVQIKVELYSNYMQSKQKHKKISKRNSLSNSLSALPPKKGFNISKPQVFTKFNKKKIQSVLVRKLYRWFKTASKTQSYLISKEREYLWFWTRMRHRWWRRKKKKRSISWVEDLPLFLKPLTDDGSESEENESDETESEETESEETESDERLMWSKETLATPIVNEYWRRVSKENLFEYIDQFHKEDLRYSQLKIQKKTFKTRVPKLFFEPWKKIEVFPTEKQHWLNNMYVRYQNLHFTDRIDFFKTYIGQIIGTTYWKQYLLRNYNYYRYLYWIPQRSWKRNYFKFKTWHKKGWWYENLIQTEETPTSAKKYILDRPKTAFQAHWTQRKFEPWKDALLFRRALYSGYSEEYRKENRFEILKIKDYLRRKNPRQEKRNRRLYGKANYLLNNFRQRSRVRADKYARIKQITGKMLRPFYGHLRPGQIKYLVKKSKNVKSDILSYNEIILNRLENRLDVVIYRLNLAPSILWARRLIKAGFIFVTPETDRFLWESMYRGLKKFSFPLKLRDPKNLYAKTLWTEDQANWVELKFLGQPNKKIAYLLQKGDLIQCAEGTYLNHFKTQSWLCRKPIPRHLLHAQKKNYAWDWRTQRFRQETFRSWEQSSESIFSTVFLNNPQFRDFDSKDRVKESFWRWAFL